MGKKKKWTKAKIMDFASEYAPQCKTEQQFYTCIGMARSTFYVLKNDVPDFANIIKKNITDIKNPSLVDMADAVLFNTLKRGLKEDATKDDKRDALTASIFIKKTIGGWRETAEVNNTDTEIIVE